MDGRYPSPHRIERAITFLRDDGVLAIPTDTTYALACLPRSKVAAKKIVQLRQLDPKKPLALIFRDLRHVTAHTMVDDRAFRVLRRFLPGPYCFILEANRELPRTIGDKRKRVGVRIPDHGVPQALLDALDSPLIVSSAIDPESGEVLHDPWSIEAVFGHGLSAVLDGGDAPGIPSSIVDLTTEPPEVIRAGLGDVGDFE